jgi:hypothetical protein
LAAAIDGGEWSASLHGRALPPGKDPRYPFDRRLGGLQSQSGHRGYRKKSVAPIYYRIVVFFERYNKTVYTTFYYSYM